MKSCTKCNTEKSLNEFSKNKRKKDGLDTQCKDCKTVARKAWKEKNPNYHTEWDAKNREKRNGYSKKYRVNNREKYLEQSRKRNENRQAYFKKYYEDNKERIAAVNKKWVEDNKERRAAYHAEWHKKNPELRKRWVDAHPEYYAEYLKKWSKENAEKLRDAYQRRRARQKAAPTEPGITVSALRERDGDNCTYCGVLLDFVNRRYSPNGCHLDHQIPIFLGGGHTWGNCVSACRTCNTKKGAKPLEEWLEILE